jgi:proline racemase
MKYDFIRGHMGGNIIVLLHGNQFQPAQELEQAVKILGPHYLAGHEAGLLYASAGGADLAVKIAEPVSKCFISACGGLTQVLGKALVETGLGRTYGIRIAEPVTEVVLKTGAGHVKIGVETSAGKAGRVWSNMQSFIREIYAGGVGPVEIKGIPVFHACKFMVVNADRVREVQPQVDFYSWDSSARELISALQEEFMRRTGETSSYSPIARPGTITPGFTFLSPFCFPPFLPLPY